MPGTGNGATITFQSGIVGSLKVRKIEFSAESLGRIDASHLGTDLYREFIPEDLLDSPEVSLEVVFEDAAAPPAVGLALGTVTITSPSGADIAGTAYVAERQLPTYENNVLQVLMLKIQFRGAITFTPA